MKSEPRSEQMHHLSNGINRAKRTASLLLALVGVMTVTGQTVRSTTQKSTGASIPGDLNARRSRHTATLLTTGKVVIAGGEIRLTATGVSGEELFDPETGTWSFTGNPQAARIGGHTATLLNDGKVLVAAGNGDFGELLDSAELYDPATGKWSATRNLITPRFVHTATLLPDGKVLVSGGINGSLALSSAELYDPSTGTWSRTGELNTFRVGHTATLLPNGKVLVVGGGDGWDNPILNSAELYDPATGTWSETGSLNTPRSGHSATPLPNGKVLIAGGFDEDRFIDSAELYNPDTGTWSITGNLHVPRRDPATLLPNGKVLVAGGSTAELYDPETGTWRLTAGLNAPREAHSATLLPDGRVLVAGGSSLISLVDRRFILNSSELYDPDTETWTGPVVPVITGTSVVGRKLVLFGENFGADAVILRNGVALQTKKSGDTRKLVAKKKAGKTIKPGDRLQVLNSSGALSKEFVFAGS